MLLDPYIKDVVCAETNLIILAIDSSIKSSKQKANLFLENMAAAEPPKTLKYQSQMIAKK